MSTIGDMANMSSIGDICKMSSIADTLGEAQLNLLAPQRTPLARGRDGRRKGREEALGQAAAGGAPAPAPRSPSCRSDGSADRSRTQSSSRRGARLAPGCRARRRCKWSWPRRPKDATHWTVRSVAEKTRISRSTVQRYFTLFGVQPHRTRSYTLSPDPCRSVWALNTQSSTPSLGRVPCVPVSHPHASGARIANSARVASVGVNQSAFVA